MEELKSEYKKILSKRKKVAEQIASLRKNDSVKKYLRLCKRDVELSKEEIDLYKKIKFDEYYFCDHMWVYVLHEYDSVEGRSYNYCGCVKCGLDERVFHLTENNSKLTLDQEIMLEYLKKHIYERGIYIDIESEFDLARQVYLEVKESHPNISDDELEEYFRRRLVYRMINDGIKENKEKRNVLSRKPTTKK